MFGRQVRMPVDLMYGSPQPPTTTVSQYAADLRSSLDAAYNQVRDSMGRKLLHQKELYDKKAHGQPFKPGDLVWLHNPAVSRRCSKKLHCPWTSPYRVVNRMAEAVYRIQHLQARRKRLVVHFDRLKPCSPDTRLPLTTPQHSRVTLPLSGTPPVGTTLELLDDQYADTVPPDVPDPGAGHLMSDSATQSTQSSEVPISREHTPDLPLSPQAPRYPRRTHAEPNRYGQMFRY